MNKRCILVNNRNDQYKGLEISEDHAGRRIDNYLVSYFKTVPKSLIYRLLRQGSIRVNKKRIKPDYRLQQNDLICVSRSIKTSSQETKILKPTPKLTQEIESSVLYEDDDLMVINKPTGLPVHGGSGVAINIIELMRQLRPKLSFLELAHRLDRETSGCLILAKKPRILRELHELLREGKVEKIYVALTFGHWKEKTTIVSKRLEKNRLSSGERFIKVSEEGKESCTIFHLEDEFEIASLVRVELKTGRTHQIRVHAASMGHPIAGDLKYGNRAFNQLLRKKGLHRLFLHACQVTFLLPSAEKAIKVLAPLNIELQKVLERLKIGTHMKQE